jgi:hypothetical protein
MNCHQIPTHFSLSNILIRLRDRPTPSTRCACPGTVQHLAYLTALNKFLYFLDDRSFAALEINYSVLYASLVLKFEQLFGLSEVLSQRPFDEDVFSCF